MSIVQPSGNRPTVTTTGELEKQLWPSSMPTVAHVHQFWSHTTLGWSVNRGCIDQAARQCVDSVVYIYIWCKVSCAVKSEVHVLVCGEWCTLTAIMVLLEPHRDTHKMLCVQYPNDSGVWMHATMNMLLALHNHKNVRSKLDMQMIETELPSWHLVCSSSSHSAIFTNSYHDSGDVCWAPSSEFSYRIIIFQ